MTTPSSNPPGTLPVKAGTKAPAPRPALKSPTTSPRLHLGDPAAIEIHALNFAYNGAPVLEDISLTVLRGEFLAVFGPNGGGKTTLLKCLLGLLVPDSGKIRVLGMCPNEAAVQVGYVPQRVTARGAFPVSAMDTVLMGLPAHLRGRLGPGRAGREAARKALCRVNMDGYADRRFGELSGGQQQRILIARALASQARLLLLDEPTANLDPQSSFCFFDFLCDLGRTTDLTIVTVSHDLTLAAGHVTAVACVNRRLLYNPEPILTPEMLTMLYGAHEHTCSMDQHLRDLSHFLKHGQDHRLHHHAFTSHQEGSHD